MISTYGVLARGQISLCLGLVPSNLLVVNRIFDEQR